MLFPAVRRLSQIGLIVWILVVSWSLSLGAGESSRDWKRDWALPPDCEVQIDAEGFDMPTAIAFVPNPGPDPKAPLYYVTELRGTIKVVTNDRSVHVFATDFFEV